MEGLKRLVEALFAGGATTVFPGIAGYPPLRSPQELQMLPDTLDQSDSSATSVHIFSSCPTGENTAPCATDSYGRVHGTDDLYIADATLLCGPTMVNPPGTVMAGGHPHTLNAIEQRIDRQRDR